MIYGIIPARLESTRLPRKMLLAETGKPLIQHTWEAAKRCPALDEVIVATDSRYVAEEGSLLGMNAAMTGEHASGTDRVAFVAKRLPNADIVVNIQGDEPEIDPRDINAIIRLLDSHPDADIATLARDASPDDTLNPNCVKVVCDLSGRALYFSRQPLPTGRIHCGIYAFRAAALQRFARLEPTEGEVFERLEQLRAIEHGMKIVVGKAVGEFHGIDTPEDYRRFVERQRNG